MKAGRDVDIRCWSTMRLKATAAEAYEPESVEELRKLAREFAGRGVRPHWVATGSNVVFGERVERPVVGLMDVDAAVADLGGGRFRAGCSVRVQRLVRVAQERGFGGIEYLFSLPASVGGCVISNAGRGQRAGGAIADVLEEVELLDLATGEIRRETPDRSAFGHHRSPYRQRPCLVLGATLRLHPQPPEETERRIRERLELVRRTQDAGLPSCGSVFRRGNRLLYHAFRLWHPRCGGLAFSAKTPDWIVNRGGGTLADFKRLVGWMERAHRLLGQTCELEIRMME